MQADKSEISDATVTVVKEGDEEENKKVKDQACAASDSQQGSEEEKKVAKKLNEKKVAPQTGEEEDDDDDDDIVDDDDVETPKDDWVPYHDRAEWKDVTPVDQPQATPLCPIRKNAYVAEVQGYMKAMLNADERSERALNLTRDAIAISKSDFVAWYYRRNILLSLGRVDLFKAELDFIDQVASKAPKNYQLYYHREAVVSFLQKHMDAEAFAKLLDSDLNWCTKVIGTDSKNYHAWSYRQWVITSFPEASDLAKEKKFIAFAIKFDPYNNSAWNYRFYMRYIISGAAVVPEDVMEDLEYTITLISRSPNNPAPWNYLDSLMALPCVREDKLFLARVKAFADEACSKYPVCSHCVVLLSDILGMEGNQEQRICLLERLRESVDTIRAKYWDSLINEARSHN